MNTKNIFSNFRTGLFICMISLGLACSGCADLIVATIAEPIDWSGGYTPQTPCESDLTLSSVEWHKEFTADRISVIGESEDIVIIANWGAMDDFELVGIDKNNGSTRWTQRDVTRPDLSYPKTYFSAEGVLIYGKKAAVHLEVKTGKIVNRFSTPFQVKSMAFQNSSYYVSSDPCDETQELGIYKWQNNDRDYFDLIYPLQEWAKHNTHLSPILIPETEANEKMLLVGAGWLDGQEEFNEIYAIDLERESLIWSNKTEGTENGFGFNTSFSAKDNLLIVGKRKMLSALALKTGEVIWENNYSTEGFYNSQPYFLDGKMYLYESYKQQNFCFELATGAELWRYTYVGAQPVYLHNGAILWGNYADSSRGLAEVENGVVGESLEHPWTACSYSNFTLIPSGSENSSIIVAINNKDLVGLKY